MKLPAFTSGQFVEANCSDASPARLVARIDGLEAFREIYGDSVASEILANVDRRLAAFALEGFRIRPADEGVYVIAAGPLDSSNLEQMTNIIQSIVGDHPMCTSVGSLVVTLSVGAVSGASEKPLDLLREAEAASVQATESAPAGRCFARAGDLSRDQNVAIVRQVLQALDENRFALAYQPILRAGQSSIVAFNECLARVLDPSGRIVPAGEFVPALEALRMTRLMDRRVLELALTELAANPTLRLSINLSAQSIGDPGWMRILDESAATAPGLATRLIVEITESALITDEARALEFIAGIRRHGCAIALDDFGAGFSAFRHLMALRPDILKIDGSFVEGIGRNPDNRAMIESILVAARHFEMMTVAEMVNDPADAIALRQLGVDGFQGNSYGQPTIEPDWRAEWSNTAVMQ